MPLIEEPPGEWVVQVGLRVPAEEREETPEREEAQELEWDPAWESLGLLGRYTFSSFANK